MKIGLWSDCHHFPSLPLMKISAYHKRLGDEVSMYSPLESYELVYASKTFSFTPEIDEEYEVCVEELRKGGTGYCISVVDGKEVFDSSKNAPLPPEIEHIYPDYSLYPNYDFAVGFFDAWLSSWLRFLRRRQKRGTLLSASRGTVRVLARSA